MRPRFLSSSFSESRACNKGLVYLGSASTRGRRESDRKPGKKARSFKAVLSRCLLLAARLSSVGTSEELREYVWNLPLPPSPFGWELSWKLMLAFSELELVPRAAAEIRSGRRDEKWELEVFATISFRLLV